MYLKEASCTFQGCFRFPGLVRRLPGISLSVFFSRHFLLFGFIFLPNQATCMAVHIAGLEEGKSLRLYLEQRGHQEKV